MTTTGTVRVLYKTRNWSVIIDDNDLVTITGQHLCKTYHLLAFMMEDDGWHPIYAPVPELPSKAQKALRSEGKRLFLESPGIVVVFTIIYNHKRHLYYFPNTGSKLEDSNRLQAELEATIFSLSPIDTAYVHAIPKQYLPVFGECIEP